MTENNVRNSNNNAHFERNRRLVEAALLVAGPHPSASRGYAGVGPLDVYDPAALEPGGQFVVLAPAPYVSAVGEVGPAVHGLVRCADAVEGPACGSDVSDQLAGLEAPCLLQGEGYGTVAGDRVLFLQGLP